MSKISPLIRIWYRQNFRKLPWRETKNPYLIWLSEIILQQTRVEQGLPYYKKFSTNYPDVHALAAAKEQDVLNDWQGLGYYSRARNLQATANYICKELKGQFPECYKDLIKLKGIGPYTAAAISSFAFDEKKAVVDGNVYRVLSRLFDISTAIDSNEGKKEFQLLADELIDEDEPGIHNQALMELGAMVCKPSNPACEACPLSALCLSFARGNFNERPVKQNKNKVRERFFHYLIFNNGKKMVIEQRQEKDIWEKLYQFPLVETSTLEDPVEYDFRYRSKPIKHLLSHQKINAVFYHFDELPKKIKDNWIIIDLHELENYPLPRLIDKYMEELSLKH